MTKPCPATLLRTISATLAVSGLILLSACGGGTGSTRSQVPPAGISVSLAPAPPASMAVMAYHAVGARVTNDSASGGVKWSCAPAGSCGTFALANTANGSKTTFTAPSTVPSGGTVTVTATSVTDSSATASSQITVTQAPSANFFVSPTGSDSNPGTLAAPFQTIAHAQTAIQGIIGGSTQSLVVILRGGNYFLTQPLNFTSADSGTAVANISWESYPGEASPVISGGLQLTNWTQGSNNVWTTTLPAGAQYFEQLFYTSTSSNGANGVRRLRARLGAPPLVGSYYKVANPVTVTTPETNCPQLTGQTTGPYQCFDRFYYTPGDPISASWANLSPPSGNPCNAPTGNPALVGDIALYSFEQMGMSKMLISCVDTTNLIIYLTGPIRFPNDATDTTTGFVTGHRYLIENVKDTFTQPGQWFLDRSQTPWVLSYVANSGENPNTDTVIIPQMPTATPQVLVAKGLQYVTFQGLTFEHDNFTVPAAGNPYIRLDESITSAVSCQNCQNVTFDTVTITQTAGTGIDFITTSTKATTANNVFMNGAIFDVASHGIRIGQRSQNSDTLANVPQFTTVQNNVIEGFGRIFAKGFGIAQGCNHDNTYTNNEIFDGYSGGINIGALNCPGAGGTLAGNNVASFNLIHDLGQGVSNDFGCVYFNTTPQNIAPPSGNKALNNVCHNVTDASIVDADGYGGQGIYIDNYTGLVDAENNLVYRVSGSTVAQTCGGQGVPGAVQNTIKNNILAYSIQSVKQQGCTPSSATNKLFDMTNNLIIYDKGNIQGGCFSCLGGNCAAVLPATVNLNSNMYCFVQSGACAIPTGRPLFYSSEDPAGQFGNCSHGPTAYATLQQWQSLTNEDLSSVQQNPFSNLSSSNSDFTLSGVQSMVGFVSFDASQAGTTSATIPVPSSIEATFPAQSYQASDF